MSRDRCPREIFKTFTVSRSGLRPNRKTEEQSATNGLYKIKETANEPDIH